MANFQNKASNEHCYFFNEEYPNKCSALACKHLYCKGCNFFVQKDDPRHNKLMHEFEQYRKLLYYPNGIPRL